MKLPQYVEFIVKLPESRAFSFETKSRCRTLRWIPISGRSDWRTVAIAGCGSPCETPNCRCNGRCTPDCLSSVLALARLNGYRFSEVFWNVCAGGPTRNVVAGVP